jgi:molecular chaperone GrpE
MTAKKNTGNEPAKPPAENAQSDLVTDAPETEVSGTEASATTENEGSVREASAAPVNEASDPEAAAEPEEQPGETVALDGELADLQDRLLRTAAEFDNYRKRQQREQEEILLYRYEPLVRELLPVLDSFERAIRSSEGLRDYQAFHDGVEMIMGQLREVLRRAGVEREEPEGEPFDPHRHEAVAAMPSEDVEADHIAMVVEPGYRLHDRVVRAARVVVSQGSGQAREGDDS